MFKTAPRYLSGVSVFYGDDITRRDTTGEVVIVIGPAYKGVKVPIALKSVDNTVPLYGSNNPLAKALYQFWDGYQDSGSDTQLQLVTMRVGGISAKLETSYGLELETSDAYDGIENNFYIYVDNTSPAAAHVKVWDTNKQIVYNSKQGIDTGHIIVTSLPVGDGGTGAFFGKDLDNDPLAAPVTIGDLVNWDLVNPTGVPISPLASIGASDTTIQIGIPDVTLVPATGTLAVKASVGAITYLVYVEYTSFDVASKTFTLKSPFGTDLSAVAAASTSVNFVGSTLVKGDSQMNLPKRKLYELMRNALLEVEQFTPDYIVPAGCAFDDTEKFLKNYTANSFLTTNVPAAVGTPQSYLVVDAAATWPVAGIATVFDGTNTDTLKYTDIQMVTGGLDPNYRLEIAIPEFVLAADAIVGDTTVTVAKGPSGAELTELQASGFIKIGTDILHYTLDAAVPGKLNFTAPLALTAPALTGDTATKVIGAVNALTTLVGTSWIAQEDFELGIGYVKETDMGDHYEFSWAASDTKEPEHYLAHFGYLFANFCNEAAVGYSTPLCGMNVKLPEAYDRASIVNWIGKHPETKIVAGMTDAVEQVTKNGTGLLGNPVMLGSVSHNRCYMSDKSNNDFADPAFGLLMTEEGFVDGHELRDSYQKVVDLGKFMCVGAGILTFNNRASGFAYNDACGIYALGLLSGVPKNEGISFRRVGVSSSTSVGVVVHRKLYNDLAGAGYVVVTREKGLGWVINNDNSVARDQSGYYLISTTRTIKTVIESKRALLVGFIGKPVNRFFFEAAKTKLAASFKEDVDKGYLNGYQYDLQIADTNRAIGKLYLKCVVNPPLELVQVDIDTVIDRNVNTIA